MLKLLISEFIGICDYLSEKAYTQKNGCFIIPRADLETLLNKNQYETALNKLKTWKALHWIDTEENRLTKRIFDGKNSKYIPCILIYRSVYLSLKVLSA